MSVTGRPPFLLSSVRRAWCSSVLPSSLWETGFLFCLASVWGLTVHSVLGGRFKKEIVVDGQSYLLLIRDEGGPPELQVMLLPRPWPVVPLS